MAIHIIQSALGHADIRLTKKHYVHLHTSDARAAIDGKLVFEGPPAATDEESGTFQEQWPVFRKVDQ